MLSEVNKWIWITKSLVKNVHWRYCQWYTTYLGVSRPRHGRIVRRRSLSAKLRGDNIRIVASRFLYYSTYKQLKFCRNINIITFFRVFQAFWLTLAIPILFCIKLVKLANSIVLRFGTFRINISYRNHCWTCRPVCVEVKWMVIRTV